MHPLPIFEIEIGLAILLAVWALWSKPEYALFLYGLALGFPDLAFPLGTAINIRLDDVLLILFLARSFLWIPAPCAKGQRKILIWEALFLTFCLGSAAIETARGIPPPPYEFAKMLGCALILLVIPRMVQSEKRLRFLTSGLVCGGIALAAQIFHHLGASSADIQANFQEYKSAAAFATWNPNTIGQAAMLAAFAAGLS
ncbi:MAG: hypothetical protein ACRD4Y_05080, partial [Candidatus Acidiferrales bacterium]